VSESVLGLGLALELELASESELELASESELELELELGAAEWNARRHLRRRKRSATMQRQVPPFEETPIYA